MTEYLHHKKNFGKHLFGDKQMMNISPCMICTAVTCTTTNKSGEV